MRFYQFNREMDTTDILFALQPASPNAPELGAVHRAELPYLWNATDLQVGDAAILTVEAIWAYWGSFAANGVPVAEDREAWPLYTPGTGDYLNLGAVIEAGTAYKQAKCDYFNNSFGL